MSILLNARSSMLVATNALGIGAASFASGTGTSFGNGDEVTEPVEVPRSDFEKRDGNMASKDIAENPTAELEAEPERPEKVHSSEFRSIFLINLFFIQKNIIPLRVQKSVEEKLALRSVIYLISTK